MPGKAKNSGVREIARRAKVAIATVDRVIHNRPGVSDKTRDRINAIIQELNYQPNILASRLASRKVYNIAVLIPSVSEETDFWEAPLKGIQRAEAEIRQYGIRIATYFFDLNDKDSFIKQANVILRKKADGVLLSPSFIDEAIRFTSSCQKKGIPYVFIDSNIPEQQSTCYIGPHLFQSGYLGAKLSTYGLKNTNKVMMVNIAREIDSHNYLQIEKGFRLYFSDHQQKKDIVRVDIRQTDYASVARKLSQALKANPDTEAIFVTNSRVFSVARFLENNGMKNRILLIGYDFIKENIQCLQQGAIDFLICHKPEEQGYRGVMALYQTLVMSSPVEKVYYMPIDIITRENQAFYRN